MGVEPQLDIEDVDRVEHGVYVRFTDGRSAVYPPDLLLALFDQAQPMTTPQDADEDLS